MKLKISLFTVSSLILVLQFCNSIEPPSGLTIELKLEDVSCTEAWVTLTTTNLALPTTLTLLQDGETRETIKVTTTDTLLYIDSLLPNQSYKFQSVIQSINQSSNELNVTTLDTTSHNFTWQSWTFGEHSSSVFYDVAILNENSIYAVGEIYMNDSLGQPDPQAYGVAIWDGQTWELKKLFYNTNFPVMPRGILVISSNEIYLAAGSIFRWDGASSMAQMVFSRFDLFDPNGTIEKLWGNSNSSIYGVGNVGSIVFYNGSQWTKIESGTDVNLSDIYGTPDGDEVWSCGWKNSDGHTVLLRIVNTQSEIIFDSFNPNNFPYNSFISSLWTNGKMYFWLTGVSDGAVKHSILNRNFVVKENFGMQYFPYRIRGIDLNDVSMSGDAAMVWHYNGYSWELYDVLLNLDDRVRSIDMKNGIIVAVGRRYETLLSTALLLIGER